MPKLVNNDFTEIKSKLTQVWLNYYDQEIVKKTQEEVERIEKDNARHYEYKSSLGNTITIHGFQILDSNEKYVRVSSAPIRARISATYLNTFNQDIWHDFSQLLSDEVERLNLSDVFNQLMNRHPWFAYSGRSAGISVLGKYFLATYVAKQLLSLLDKPAGISSWNDMTVQQMKRGILTWKNEDPAWLKKYIEGFPLYIANALYRQDSLAEYSTFALKHDAQKNTSTKSDNWHNHKLSRLDIFRFLVQNTGMPATNVDGIWCTQYAPFHIDELVHLSENQWQHFNTLIINLNTEDDPLWIVLSKQDANWVAYVSDEIRGKHALKLAQLPVGVKIETVDYQANALLDDMAQLDTTTQWHTMVLGRIFPWCKRVQPKSALSDYRTNVPLSFMHQKVLADCLLEDKATNELADAFVNRSPMSDFSFARLNPLPDKKQINYLLDNAAELNNTIEVSQVLSAFDNEELVISTDQTTLTVNNSEDLLQTALTSIYHAKMSRLKFTPPKNYSARITKLMDYDVNLRTVATLSGTPPQENLMSYSHPMHCAARNRFLATVKPDYQKKAQNNIGLRKQLWPLIGQEMVSFFQKQGKNLDLDSVRNIIQFNTTWRETCCDHTLEEMLPSSQWAFVQIAQMGTQGLTAMFTYLENAYASSWNATDKEPAPNLDCTFDLSGGLAEGASTYLTKLTELINTFDKKKVGCAPLFHSLAVILPTRQLTTNEIMNFINGLNQRNKTYPQDCNELVLHNLATSGPGLEALLNALELAANKGLQVLIRIPAWDREIIEEPQFLRLKSQYRQIQNKILDNQRGLNSAHLPENTKSIYDEAKGALKPEVIIDDKLAQQPQSWDGDDVFYPLTSQAPGIQQQLQQEIHQEFVQEQEQEEEQEQEQEQEQAIAQYAGDESNLITRSNIDEKCDGIWQKITDEVKDYSGWKKDKLAQLFSLWVGSEQSAQFVIEKIQPAAVEKIMQHATQFRLGISKDNLPPGFYLAHSIESGGLILCFDEKREKENVRARAALTIKKRNPFTLELHKPRPATEFRGDFRQFSLFSDDKKSLQTLWKYLATEDNDEKRIEMANLWLEKNNTLLPKANASVILQRFEAYSEIKDSGDRKDCLGILKNWAKEKGASEPLLIALFDQTEKTVLTEKNLSAFGQLFNHTDIQSKKNNRSAQELFNGSSHWLFMANQLLTTFGKPAFEIWKTRFLDVSKNWSEYLEKEEVDALALSIATLKNKSPAYQNVWWQLVDAHGAATGHMRYAPLWYAYQKLIGYLEDNDLIINQEVISAYLSGNNEFNGQVFLDRLYLSLKAASTQFSRREIQQRLLDHIDKIDWHHNGYYYACRYESYPYWNKDIQLQELTPTFECEEASYTAKWDNVIVKSGIAHALRFVSQRMQLSINEFDTFQQVLQNCPILQNNSSLLRLFVCCIAKGCERVNALDYGHINEHLAQLEKLDPDFLIWLNQQLLLDEELHPHTLHLKFDDIASFIKSCFKSNLNANLFKLKQPQAMEFINACGRALQCYKLDNVNGSIEALTNFVQDTQTFSHPLVTVYPWLISNSHQPDPITEANKRCTLNTERFQLSLFEQQLKSIDFKKTTYLPNYQTLTDACNRIVKAGTSAAVVRLEIVSGLLAQGCAITYQDAPFRPLEPSEIKTATTYLEMHLNDAFKQRILSLCQKLLQNHLTVKADAVPEAQIEALMKCFVRLDNKTHYDELSQVLGLLLEKSSQSGMSHYYSLPQLTTWLNYLINEQTFDKQHYPINLLNELLDNALEQNGSSLLHRDLNRLSARSDAPEQQSKIREIIKDKLPNQYKPILVKLALQDKKNLPFVEEARICLVKLHDKKVDLRWINAVTQLIGVSASLKPSNRSSIITECTQLPEMLFSAKTDESLAHLWQQTQIKLIDWVVKKAPTERNFENIFNNYFQSGSVKKSAYIKMIFLLALKDWDKEQPLLANLKQKLNAKSENELRELALYYASEPTPSLTLLGQLLAKSNLTTTNSLIHHFETVVQATNEDGSSKRQFSLSEKDTKGLLRVLAGIKRKERGYLADQEQKQLVNLLFYLNHYSELAALPLKTASELACIQANALSELKACRDESSQHQASARLLACMRETLLRKTGKWANHTQMIDLLYAALYNNESLVHQVRTGEGKSIITIMRCVYLALNGYVVDVYTAKESLSKRDHEEFAPVLEAMGLRHAYITDTSPVKKYQTSSGNGIGAVNYLTIGNFSLFDSTHVWKGEEALNLDPANRVAFLDEGDYIFLDEQTQFNYSDSQDSDATYNLDEWVYRATYDFYLQKKDNFLVNEEGLVSISRKRDLSALCDHLQKHSTCRPKQSTFFDKYIIPALNGEKAAIEKRDQQLKQLLSAVHIAYGLQEGSSFCIRPDSKTVTGGMDINTRFAKVVIANQVRDGSTYSDLVHQFLHVILNKKSSDAGEKPDFFVEPYTQIALSGNAPYILKKHYHKLESLTGTAGNTTDLEKYESDYKIQHVIKVPTQEEVRTQFLPTCFCASEVDQIDSLVKQILNNKNRPILITCENDIAVKRIGRLIKEKLKQEAYSFEKFIVDTNDSGKTERDVVPFAGESGAVTISSRMGRGTDIKPKSDQGLMVLRTYPAIPRVEKQERGRQGRNGALGSCQDILNVDTAKKLSQSFQKSTHAKRLKVIIEAQQENLKAKLDKHQHRGSSKWAWLQNDEAKQHDYIVVRATEQLKQELKQQKAQYLQRKEALIASLSGSVVDVLRQCVIDKDKNKHAQLREAWLGCRKQIEAAWNGRLAGEKSDSEAVYQAFFKKMELSWLALQCRFQALDPLFLQDIPKPPAELTDDIDTVRRFLEATIGLWTDKKKYNKLQRSDLSTLEKIRQQYKQIAVQYHPDRNPNADAALMIQANALKDVITDCIQKINPNNAPVQPEEKVLPSASNPPQSGGTLMKRDEKVQPMMSLQLNDMTQVLTFYQQWLKNSETYYFIDPDRNLPAINALYNRLNARNISLMDDFYQHLQRSSAYDKNSPLTPQQQTFRREQLFKKLSELTNKQSFHCISCDVLQLIVTKLMTKKEITNDAHYLQCIKTFFNQEWMTTHRTGNITADTLVKNSRLLELIVEILMTGEIPLEEPLRNLTLRGTHEFIEKLTRVATTYFWDKFDRIDDIKVIFASKPKTTRLLTLFTNEKDLAHFIDLIYKNQGTNFDKERLDILINTIEQQADFLEKKPLLIRPLFTLALTGDKKNYLPELNCLENLGSENQSRFWHFLTQRLPIEQKDCEELIRSLLTQQVGGAFNQEVANPLFDLPSSLSLPYINRYLRFTVGQYHYTDSKAPLKAMKKAGKQFEKFIDNFKLSSPLALKWQIEVFNKTSPEINDKFYKIAKKYPTDSVQTIRILAEAFRANQLTTVDLDRALALNQQFSQLKEGALKQFLNDHLLMAINQPDNEALGRKIERLCRFSMLMNHHEGLTLEELFKLFTHLKSDGDTDAKVMQSLAILQALKQRDIDYPGYDYTRIYLNLPVIVASKMNEKYQFFINMIKTHREIPNEAVNTLFNAYLVNNTIDSERQLAQTVDVIEEGIKLNVSKNYGKYFSTFNASEKAKREIIMQYLYHDLLNLGVDFKKRCNAEYLSLAKKIVKIPEKVGSNPEARNNLHQCFQQVVSFMRELTHVSLHPFGKGSGSANHPVKSGYVNYFEAQQKRYASFWFVGEYRKKQAEDLFSQLYIIRSTTREDYYERSIQLICHSQIMQMNDDIDTHRNKKGYSRLYDITTQMLLTLMRDLLIDDEISFEKKSSLNTTIQKHFEAHVMLLKSRLPTNHPLKLAITELWKRSSRIDGEVCLPGSTEYTDLKKSLDASRNSIPKHLTYIVDTLDCFITLSSMPYGSETGERLNIN